MSSPFVSGSCQSAGSTVEKHGENHLFRAPSFIRTSGIGSSLGHRKQTVATYCPFVMEGPTGLRRRIRYPNPPARTDAVRIPILAYWVSGGINASSATKRETVNPIPARSPTPAIAAQVTPSGRVAAPDRTAIADAARIPSGLPTNSPTTMPQATGAEAASANASSERWIPALASANRG